LIIIANQKVFKVAGYNQPAGTKKHLLRKVPDDVRRIILKQQGILKGLTGRTQYSMETTIYHIIRDWQRCRGGKDIEV